MSRSKPRAADGSAEIVIFDAICAPDVGEGISSRQIDAELKALGPVAAILLRINSPGGDVYEGLAIYNMLKAHPATITARIEGMAASVASLIAMAADRIEMPSNAMFLIHEPRFDFVAGTAGELTKAASDLDIMTASFVAAYAEKTKGHPKAIAALMAEDRVMSAAEAKALGFADVITDAVKMTASYPLAKLPKKARAVVEAALSQGRLMTKRAPAKRPRAADDNDAAPTLKNLQDQISSLAKAIAAMTDDDDSSDDDRTDPTASDDDGQSDADTDDPRGSDDDSEDEDDRDVPPPAPPKSKAKARAPRTFRSGQEQALAYAQQVTETCQLAGQPGKAAAFIAARKPLADIRSDLMKTRASAGAEATPGQHRYAGARGNAASDNETAKGWTAAVAKANASLKRTPGRKG